MVNNVVFDVNGVLVNTVSVETASQFDYSIDEAVMLLKMGMTDIWKKYDLGFYMTRESMIDDFIAYFPQEEELVRKVLTRRHMIVVNEEMEKFLLDLKLKGIKVYLLSNVGYGDLNMVKKFRFAKEVDGAVYSCEEGKVKPDQEIFEALMEKYGLKAEETVFIDDSGKNLKSAEQIGFKTVRYITPRKTKSEVYRIIATE